MAPRHLLSIPFALLLLFGASELSAAAPSTKKVKKTLKTLITAIRYGKNDLAAKQLDFEMMSERIMASDWAKLSDVEKKEFAANLESLIRKLSFTKGKEMFKHLDAVLYDDARSESDGTHCKSTVVIHRNYKKTEIVIDWVLRENGGSYRVVDTVMLGESTAEGIQEDQIEPLMEEGGTKAVLEALRNKVAELEKK